MTFITTKLTNKKVLLVGGTSGVGFAVASLVLAHGGIAIISSSDPTNLSSAMSRLTALHPTASSRIHGTTCDLLDQTNLDTNIVSLLTFAQHTSDSPGPVHHIVFTAGNRQPIPPVSSASLGVLQRLSAVRYVAPVFLAKHAVAFMAAGPEASITLTTNAGEEKPMKGWGLSLSATSLTGLVRGMAVDLAPLRTNLVKLGFVKTELLQALAGAGVEDEGERKKRLETLLEEKGKAMLTGQVGDPESVAEAYLYFMKDANVTGQSITTDGGYTLV